MELVNFNADLQMAFFSFGEQHHDIAVIKVPDDQPVGSTGLSHTALQIEGGAAELRAFYQRLKAHGVQVDFTAEHFLTKSIYFFDPDGNRLELFCESMEMAAAKQYLHDARELSELMQPLDLESATAS
jgi:catechol-2,3-dioxygenase